MGYTIPPTVTADGTGLFQPPHPTSHFSPFLLHSLTPSILDIALRAHANVQGGRISILSESEAARYQILATE